MLFTTYVTQMRIALTVPLHFSCRFMLYILRDILLVKLTISSAQIILTVFHIVKRFNVSSSYK